MFFQGKNNRLKGICFFGAVSKDESESISRRMEAKNIEYLECAWRGHGESLGVFACHNRQLYDHIACVLDIGVSLSTFLGEEYGLALGAGACFAIVEGIAFAGLPFAFLMRGYS